MRVKICGITCLEDALLCAGEGADALGFVFYRNSPRYIRPDEAAEIVRHLPPFITAVGVFVNETAAVVNATARKCGLNAVQLHGEEPVKYLEDISHPVIKAFRIKGKFDFSPVRAYGDCLILLDGYARESYGGTGISFDWSQIPPDLRRRCILAGGISSANIRRVHKKVQPAAVDLSSSIESAPGRKDAEKVRLFFDTLQNCRNEFSS